MAPSNSGTGSVLLQPSVSESSPLLLISEPSMALYAEDYYRLGTLLLEDGNLSDALEKLRQAEAEQPLPGYELQVTLGRTLAELGRGAEAVGYFRRCIQLHPDRPEAYLEWSYLCRRQGQKIEAAKLEAFGMARGGHKRQSRP